MLVIRPARADDIDALGRLAAEAGTGMTSMPNDRERLEAKIQASLQGFAATAEQPGDESYLFLMEDTASGRVVGSCALFAAVGLNRPFYSFKILSLTHTSRELERYEPVEALQMVEEYQGTSEIATLFLTRDCRRDRNGETLSRSRFLFMADFRQRFDRLVLAEMRGVQDENGHSVFWENLGRHFIPMDFSKADYLSSLGNYQFIADLMPRHPVYVRLLPEEAQAVIGKTHSATRPALEFLKREGFRFEGCVDVFDAGPTVHCPVEAVRTVRHSCVREVARVVDSLATDSGEHLLANSRLDDYRVCRTRLLLTADDGIHIDADTAAALRLHSGDQVRLADMASGLGDDCK